MENVFLCLLVACLIYFGTLVFYPLFALLRSLIFSNKVDKSTDYLVPVSIILVCYKEEKYIRERIVNLLDDKEWIPGSELIIISSGSEDKTNEIIQEFQDVEAIKHTHFPSQLSKINGLNLAFDKAKHEILVFSDCRQEAKPGSLKQLVHNFNDPHVGTVTATIIDTKNTDKPSFFRTLITFIAIKESAVSSSLNVYGALYAQRKSVYRKISDELLFDDLFVVVSTLSQRQRLIQDDQSVIYDVNFDDYYQEERIRRLMRGLLLFLFKESKLIMSLSAGTLIRFLIVKYLKLLMPFFLSILIISSLGLLVYSLDIKWLFVGVTCFGVGIIIPSFRRFTFVFLRINYYFLRSMISYFFAGKQSNLWDKLKYKSIR